MKLRVWGPVVFATMLFTISYAIRLIAFKEYTFVLDLPTDFCLWGVGILFTMSASEEAWFGARTAYRVTRKQSGTGIEVDFGIELPDQVEFSAKFIYLFVFTLMLWILVILLSGHAKHLLATSDPMVYPYAVLSYCLAGINIGVSMCSIVEVAS